MHANTQASPVVLHSMGSATIDPQLCACGPSMLSRAPPLGCRRPAGTLKGLPTAFSCYESSSDLEWATKRKARIRKNKPREEEQFNA